MGPGLFRRVQTVPLCPQARALVRAAPGTEPGRPGGRVTCLMSAARPGSVVACSVEGLLIDLLDLLIALLDLLGVYLLICLICLA